MENSGYSGNQQRPQLTLHLFGSSGCGKATFRQQWYNNSYSRPLSEIADVRILIKRDTDLESGGLPAIGTDDMISHTFLIIYRPDSQGSRQFAQRCIQKLDSHYNGFSPQVFVLENHFELTYKSLNSEPLQLPPSFLSSEIQLNACTCKFWSVRFENGMDQHIMEHILISPLMNMLDEDLKLQLIVKACTQGQLAVLKLLAGRVENSNPVGWLSCVIASLEQQHPNSTQTAKLLLVAEYLYNLDSTLFLSTVVRMANTHPQVSLDLINRFRPQGQSDNHFVKSGLALFSVPVSWVQNRHFTHINLSNNLLLELPEELFQLSTLKGLDISHNCLGSVPDILKWNCPNLRELNLSFNRLVDTTYCILNRPRNREDRRTLGGGSPARPDQQAHYDEARRLYFLTGYNLYPCVHSLNWVCLNSNASLTQVPEWVCVLPNLTLLEMTNLPKLTSLTPYLAHCRNLCILKIDIHRLVSPPAREVLHSGTVGIMAYLRCQLRGSTPYRHLKLVLIGANGSGKTTLFSQLVRIKSQPLTMSSPSSKTHMELATFEYRGEHRSSGRSSKEGGKGKKQEKYRPKITFQVINFVSEEVFQSIYQCFLTHRTLFLCLWDTTKGIESLQSLVPWLCCIQASAPGSSVVIIGTHIDQRPALSRATIAQWEKEVFGDAICLNHKSTHPRNREFPIVSDSVVMNCQNRRDVEKLMENVYQFALQLKHPKTRTLLMEEMVPRSYHELQTLVEVKLRGFQRKGQSVPILRREEFIDHVRSLTLYHDNLEKDEEEFSLAVRFLHEAGTIIYYKSQVLGMNELYFLSPQWLFNTLGSIMSQLKQRSQNALISSSTLPLVFQNVDIPAHYYNNFRSMLEENDIIVSLDMEKNIYLIPSALDAVPPSNYPSYNLTDSEHSYLMQYIHLNYVPSGFFPRLLSRVLINLHMLSGQLLALGSSPLTRMDPTMKQSNIFSTVRHRYELDKMGYVREDDLAGGMTTEKRLLDKIWALSTTNLATWSSRHRSLTEKLVTLSRPILNRKERQRVRSPTTMETEGEGERGGERGEDVEEENTAIANEMEEGRKNRAKEGSNNPLDLFSQTVVWEKGLYVEFPCGTCFWLESCERALAIIAKGDGVVPRVKVTTFLTACVDMLIDEFYSGVRLVYYNPCPSCLSRYWSEKTSGPDSLTGDGLTSISFAQSDLELSGEVNSLTLNEFSGTASFIRRSSSDHNSLTRRFSGTSLKLENSPSSITADCTFPVVSSDGGIMEEVPCVLLDGSVILYSLASLIIQSVQSSSVQCSKCKKPVSLHDIGPHVLLADFLDKLLINSRNLLYGEGDGAVLGEGGFGKVVKGTYDSHPVAVKLFHKTHRADSLARQYKSLREELTVLSHLDHPRVVKLLGVSLRPLCLVMDLAPQGSLSNHLDLCPLGLNHVVAHQALYQIADGIRYLHSLYIIHRDIKPGNILVWSLDPNTGVDVRLADYGVSQFSTPSGLWRHKGTEEYMAPELRANSSVAYMYDEKVDIFSFALLLHLVVTGRKLFAGILNRRDQLQMIYRANFPQLSQALAKSIEENRPQCPDHSLQHIFAESGRHPAARRNIDSSCYSTCMQPLMDHCLARSPANRPCAQGICSRLLVCPGGLQQIRFFIPSPVSWAAYSPSENHIIGMQEDADYGMLIIPGAWLYRKKALPYHGQKITCLALVGEEVFMGSAETNLVFSMKLPALTSGHISPILLPGAPLCIIPQQTAHGAKIVVGMSAARIAVFAPPGQGRHLLETHPFITQIMSNSDPEKTAISCGVHYKKIVWCGCGRYLVGLDSKEYMLKHYKPLIKDATQISHMICALGQLWVSFDSRTELVAVDTQTAQCAEPIDCHRILGRDCSSVDASITDLVSSGEAVWAGTNGGHVITFDPVSADVLLVHRRYCHVSALVCVGTEQVVVFGRERVEGVDGEADNDKTVFTVWDSYVKYRVT